MKWFVTGATGLVGRRLVAGLLARGDQVVCLTRSLPSAKELLPPAVRLVAGDPAVGGDWQRELRDCDGAVNLAGEPVFQGLWTPGKKRRIRRSRLAATACVAAALAEREGPGVLVNASAVGYYGDGGERALGEDSQPGQDFLARLAHEWENTARGAEREQVRVVMLRIGIVLDAAGGALPALLRPFRWGLGGPLGNGRQYFPWIHQEDLNRAILFALDTPDLSGPVNAVAPNPPTQAEFARALGRVLGKPAFLPTPRFALRLLLGGKADLLLAGQRALPNALRARGFQFRYQDATAALEQILLK